MSYISQTHLSINNKGYNWGLNSTHFHFDAELFIEQSRRKNWRCIYVIHVDLLRDARPIARIIIIIIIWKGGRGVMNPQKWNFKHKSRPFWHTKSQFLPKFDLFWIEIVDLYADLGRYRGGFRGGVQPALLATGLLDTPIWNKKGLRGKLVLNKVIATICLELSTTTIIVYTPFSQLAHSRRWVCKHYNPPPLTATWMNFDFSQFS